MASGADIQVELGNWAKVHNLILEKLAKANLSGREAKCLFYLLRMTYGKQEKEHSISLSLWADGTGIDKRHVKPILDDLIERNIVYRIDGKKGRGNTSIYGFNKYFEQWNDAEKVPSTVPIKKVLPTVPFLQQKVPSTVPEKVPSTVPNKERSRASSLLAADESDDVMALVRLAYEAACRIGPPMREEKGRADLLIASRLIERYGYADCIRGISTLKDRFNAMVKKNRHGISAPLPYLRTIMEGELGTPVAVPATVDFAIEDTQ